MIGQTISYYKILENLGEGGMGVVYKAHDTKLDRDVALKFLTAQLSSSDADKARFMQEAKAAASLNHPNICTIYGIDEFEGQLFIAMELVDGQTLREKRGQISFKQAIDIGIQVADGLAAAHEKGIVHRDIKPENIMVRKDGIAQIMDFGLAKLRNASSNANRLTKEGSTVGTAGYMSPEQITGSDVDHRSDIFSFGVLLFELVTGQLPFKGVHETALAYEIVNVDAPPISSLKPEVDAELDRIVLECLDKDPNERTQSAKQVSVDLKRFKRESGRDRMSRVTAARPALKITASSEEEEPAGSSWRRHFGYILSAFLAVGLVISVWAPWKKTESTTRPIVRSSITLPTKDPIVGLGIAISPDGKNLVYAGNSGQFYLHRMDQSTFQPISGAVGTVPTFSPDGKWIAYQAYGKILKVSLTGSAPEIVCPLQSFTPGVWWTPDNKLLLGNYSSGLSEVSAAGGIPVSVTALDSAAGEISHRFPQLLPDGKTVIYTAKTKDMNSFDDALIVATRRSNGERKVLVKGGYYGRYIPSGHLIYMRGNTIFAVQFDAERLELSGSPVPIEQGGAFNDGRHCLAISENGVAVFCPPSAFASSNEYSLGWMDRAAVVHPLFDTLRNYLHVVLSPDGQRIAVEIGTANDDIWMYDISRGLLSRLTFGWGNNNFPIWSPDGKYVYYSAEKGQIANIYRQPWDGGGKEERLTTSSKPQRPVSVTRDGKYVSFEEDNDIWILPLDAGGTTGPPKPYPYIQTPAKESGGYFSPDGKWMSYMSDESGKDEVYVVEFPKHEGKRQVSNGGGLGGVFSRDGKELFYANGQSCMVVDVKQGTSFEFSVPRKLCTIPSDVNLQDVSLDGSKFLSLIHQVKPDSVSRLDVVTEWFEVVKSKFAKN